MKKFINISLLTITLLGLSGCASNFIERKAPCPPSASLSQNPCNPMPINLAEIKVKDEGIKS